MTGFWTPTSTQYPALVLLAALILLGVTIIIGAVADARRERLIDETLRRRYRWTGHAD